MGAVGGGDIESRYAIDVGGTGGNGAVGEIGAVAADLGNDVKTADDLTVFFGSFNQEPLFVAGVVDPIQFHDTEIRHLRGHLDGRVGRGDEVRPDLLDRRQKIDAPVARP